MAKRTHARPNLTQKVPPGIGPYEFWFFGAGRKYASSLQKPSRYLAALAELERRRTPGPKYPTGTPKGATKVWLPTLWKPRLPNGTQFEPRFVPFVIDQKLASLRTDPEELRRRLLSGISQREIREHLECVDIEKSRFRVGLPVAEKAMKPELPVVPTGPVWRSDETLRRRIGPNKRIMIFAIIDDGLPFAHRNFRDVSGRRSRVEFCWLQSAEACDTQKSV